jgi:hypothetical protein
VTTPAHRRDERIKHATRSINRTVLAFAFVVVIVLISIVGCRGGTQPAARARTTGRACTSSPPTSAPSSGSASSAPAT